MQVVDDILSRGVAPTRADIAAVLSAIAPPGKKLKTKQNTISDLFDSLGHPGVNSQGHSVIDDLTGWAEY